MIITINDQVNLLKGKLKSCIPGFYLWVGDKRCYYNKISENIVNELHDWV